MPAAASARCSWRRTGPWWSPTSATAPSPQGFATALRPCPPATSESAAVPTAHPAFVTGPVNTVVRLRRGPGARRRRQPRLRASPRLGRQRLPGVRRRRAGPRSPPASATAARPRRWSPPTPAPSCAGGWPARRAGATVCALTRVLADGQPVVVGATAATDADGSYAIELPAGPSREVYVHYVVGDSVLARHGLIAALERAPGARRPPQPRRPRPRPPLLQRRAPGPALLRPRGQGPGADRQAPLAGLSHRPRRRALRVHRPLQAARDLGARKRYRFRALVPQAGRLSLRAAATRAR